MKLASFVFAFYLLGNWAHLSAQAQEVEKSPFDLGIEAYDQGNYEEAYRLWLPLARENNLAALRNTGHLLRLGLGVDADPSKAFDFYERAAEAGLVGAQVNLGNLYAQGIGTKQSHQNAAHWYAKAAKAGHPHAQYELGVLVEQGLGTTQDRDLALALYLASARAGHSQAIEKVVLKTARNSPIQNPSLENERDEIGGESGVELTKTISRMLSPPADPEFYKHTEKHKASFFAANEKFKEGHRGEAFEIWRHLEQAGMTDAMMRVGYSYFLGLGVGRSPERALGYFRLAEAEGHPDGPDMVNKALREVVRLSADTKKQD